MPVDEELLRKAEKGRGTAIKMLPDDRQWHTYYDPSGVALRLPADPASFMVYIGKGFTLKPPRDPEPRPISIIARDGSVIDMDSMTRDDWDGKKRPQGIAPTAAVSMPTLTYYTAEGHPLPGLPADPVSLAAYLAAGLSLNPPEGADMAHTTGYYYNRDGAREGPFPNWGDWPAKYAERGYTETPPGPPPDDDEDESDGLEGMTLAVLKALASASETDITGLKKKADIVAAIRLEREANPSVPDEDEDEDDPEDDE